MLYRASMLSYVALVCGDVYMQYPPGSNNRLDEGGGNRNNNNRLMDTQNNAKVCGAAGGTDDGAGRGKAEDAPRIVHRASSLVLCMCPCLIHRAATDTVATTTTRQRPSATWWAAS